MYKLSLLKKFLNKGHERSIKARKNIIFSFLIKGFSVLINLFLVRITIDYISPSEYGIWITLSSVVAWFSFFDIGFGHGLRNKFASALANDDKKLARIYVSTTYAATCILILTVWTVFVCINKYINWNDILNAGDNSSNRLNAVALIIFSFFSLQFVLKLVGTILQAKQESAKSSLFDLIIQFFTAIAIFILMHINVSGNVQDLAIITGSIQVFVLATSSIILFSTGLKEFRPSIKYVEFKFGKDLMGIGIKFFIIQVSAVFIFETTNIVVTQILGPEFVTVYNIAFKYFSIATMLCGIIASPFWSAFTEAYVKHDYIWMKKIISQLNKFWLLIIVLIIFLLLSSNYLYEIWIGSKVKISWSISILMAINMIFVTRLNIYVLLVNATGKIYLQLITNVILSIIFIPYSIILCKNYGLAGVVIANISVNLIYAILIPIQSNRILNQRSFGIWNK